MTINNYLGHNGKHKFLMGKLHRGYLVLSSILSLTIFILLFIYTYDFASLTTKLVTIEKFLNFASFNLLNSSPHPKTIRSSIKCRLIRFVF